MSSPTALSPHPVVDALALLEAAADRLDAAELWQLRSQELADSVDRFESVLRRLEFGRLRLLAEFDVQDAAGEAGLSTEAFYGRGYGSRRLRRMPGCVRRGNWSARSACRVRLWNRSCRPQRPPPRKVCCRRSMFG